jgi:pyrroline-5-carboxylate reductase
LEGHLAKLNKKIGIIGGGNMGEAFIGALVKTIVSDPSMVKVSDVMSSRLDYLQKTFSVSPVQHNSTLFAECDVVILAVKPQQMAGVLAGITYQKTDRILKRKLIMSIAAGIPLKRIEDFLYAGLDDASKKRLPIIRVMPNTPALVLAGMSGISPNPYTQNQDLAVARKILSAMGKVIEVDEADLDAVTALSGSGPAYVFYLIESMIAAGIMMGLDSENAKNLTITTLKGALALLEKRGQSPEQLRHQVTSPGGTTEAAINVLETRYVKQSFIDAITAARARAKALSEILY